MWTGELMWVMGRTRPDLAYSVGLLSRLLHRRPQYVGKLAQQVLRYLAGSPEEGLTFKPGNGGGQAETMRIYADTSFAPPHEKFRSIQGLVIEHQGNPIMWESTRQAFICQSTAEAELLGYNEALQAGLSTHALFEALEVPVSTIELYGDNRAALTQCNADTGSWRTRHLRLRAAKLREILASPESG